MLGWKADLIYPNARCKERVRKECTLRASYFCYRGCHINFVAMVTVVVFDTITACGITSAVFLQAKLGAATIMK